MMSETEQIDELIKNITLEMGESDKKLLKIVPQIIKKIPMKKEKKALDFLDKFITTGQKDINLSSEDEIESDEEEELLNKKRKPEEPSFREEIENERKKAKKEENSMFFCVSQPNDMIKRFRVYLTNLLLSSTMDKGKWIELIQKKQSQFMKNMWLSYESSRTLKSDTAVGLANHFSDTENKTQQEKQTNKEILETLKKTTTVFSTKDSRVGSQATCTLTASTLTKKNSFSVIMLTRDNNQVREHCIITSRKWVDFLHVWTIFCTIDELVTEEAKKKLESKGMKMDIKDIQEFLKDDNEVESLLFIYKIPFIKIYELIEEKSRKELAIKFGPLWFKRTEEKKN